MDIYRKKQKKNTPPHAYETGAGQNSNGKKDKTPYKIRHAV